MKNLFLKFVVIAFAIFQFACAKASSNAETSNSCTAESFIALPIQDKVLTLKRCTPAERVELYLKWSFWTYPPNFDLAEAMASFGEEIVPAILARIEAPGAIEIQGVKPELLHLLYLMHVRGYYDLNAEAVIMKKLEISVMRIGDKLLRAEAETAINTIKGAGFGSRPVDHAQ